MNISSLNPVEEHIKMPQRHLFSQSINRFCGAAIFMSVVFELAWFIIVLNMQNPNDFQLLPSVSVLSFIVGLLALVVIETQLIARFCYGVAIGSYIFFEISISHLLVVKSGFALTLLFSNSNLLNNLDTFTLIFSQLLFSVGIIAGSIIKWRLSTLKNLSVFLILLGIYWIFEVFNFNWGNQIVQLSTADKSQHVLLIGMCITYIPFFVLMIGTAISMISVKMERNLPISTN